jgi:ADP-ribose pyrophosphatase YjhB (NUDIX family)
MADREYPAAPVLGVGAVVLDGDRVLLVKRANPPLQGEWSLPGGVLELGETLAEACAREVLEETGLEVEVAGLVELLDRIVYENTGYENAGPVNDGGAKVRYHYVLADYYCRVKSGTLRAASDAESAQWVSFDQLDQCTPPVQEFTLAVVRKAKELRERK